MREFRYSPGDRARSRICLDAALSIPRVIESARCPGLSREVERHTTAVGISHDAHWSEQDAGLLTMLSTNKGALSPEELLL